MRRGDAEKGEAETPRRVPQGTAELLGVTETRCGGRRPGIVYVADEMVRDLGSPWQRLAAAVIVRAVSDLALREYAADARRFLRGAYAEALALGVFVHLEQPGWQKRVARIGRTVNGGR